MVGEQQSWITADEEDETEADEELGPEDETAVAEPGSDTPVQDSFEDDKIED